MSAEVTAGQRNTKKPRFWNYCGTMSFNEDSNDPSRLDIPHQYYHISKEPKSILHRFGRESRPPRMSLTLNVKDVPSRYNIRVTQIICNGTDLQAPEGCDQYYRER